MKDIDTIATTVAAGQGNGPRRAVVLLSGGLDSATAAAWAVSRGLALSALSVDYGQRHRVELDAARDVARALGITDHVVARVDLAAFGGSALVDASIAVPHGRSGAEISHGIPVTYVPALLSFSTGSPISCRRRASTGTGITGCLHPTTSSGGPSRRLRSGTSESAKRR